MKPISLSDEGLPAGWGPWDLPTGWQYLQDGGPDGAPALRLQREDAAEYLNARLRCILPGGQRFCISGSMLLETPVVPNLSARTNIEFFDADNRYLGSSSLPPVASSSEWIRGSMEFTVPEFTAECRLMFYLNAGVTGAARFALPSIAPAPFRWTAYPLTPVRDELPATGGDIMFGFFSLGTPDRPDEEELKWSCRVELLDEDHHRTLATVPITRGRFVVAFPPLPPGQAILRLTLLDERNLAYGEKRLHVTIAQSGMRSSFGCAIDRKGRAIYHGRPYLPLGLYMGMIERDEIEEIANSPFNCLLPYGSMLLGFQDSELSGVPAIREVLDACFEQEISVIFSMAGLYDDGYHPPEEYLGEETGAVAAARAAQAFRDHPALLAWYVNDEQPIECIPRLVERRQLVRNLDPDHPIYAVMCQVPELPFYSEIVDVYGIDPYPVVDPAIDHIRISRYAHDMAEQAVRTDSGLALWTVVQAHNIGAYDHRAKQDPEYYRQAYRDPSFDEILALSLLAVIRGAKGLLFYSYPDLAHPDFDAGSRSRRWENLYRAGQIIRNLEPFLLSDAVPSPVELRVIRGEVEARAFRDEQGRECALIVGIGPGQARAELAIPAGEAYSSLLSRTSLCGNGRLLFEGDDICADVLYLR